MSDAEDFSGARGAPDANAGMLRAAGGSRPSPRLIEEIYSGEGGDSPTDRLGTLATEANRLFPDRRGTIGVGRSEVVTPGDAADEDDPAARLVRNFRLFLSPAATAKLQAMAGAIKECRRSGDPDMAGVLLKSMQALVDSETLGSSGSRGDEGIKVPVGVSLGAASAGHNPLSAFDHDLLQSFDAHVGRSSLFDSAGVPLITLTTKPAAVFDILGRLVGELNSWIPCRISVAELRWLRVKRARTTRRRRFSNTPGRWRLGELVPFLWTWALVPTLVMWLKCDGRTVAC